MARLIYALPSVGMGHAIRAKVIIKELQKKHQVLVLTSGKSYDYLKKEFTAIEQIPGLEINIKNNSVHVLTTLYNNLKKINKKNYKQIKEVYKKVKAFKPQLVLSDFETMSAYMAYSLDVPLVEIDNQKYLTEGDYIIPASKVPSFLLARLVIWLITKKADAYITLIRKGERIESNKKVYAIPPILREEMCTKTEKTKEQVLVYTATHTEEELEKVLQKCKAQFTIYGYKRAEKQKNCTYKKFNEKEFIKDFTSAKAIITTGGFSVISEALAQAKPLLVIPIQKHFEQELNGRYVEEHHYGLCERKLTKKGVELFLTHLKKFSYKPVTCKNKEAFTIIEKVIEKERK